MKACSFWKLALKPHGVVQLRKPKTIWQTTHINDVNGVGGRVELYVSACAPCAHGCACVRNHGVVLGSQ
eukprot:7712532-Alexandrium_andersonii.AAC.1